MRLKPNNADLTIKFEGSRSRGRALGDVLDKMSTATLSNGKSPSISLAEASGKATQPLPTLKSMYVRHPSRNKDETRVVFARKDQKPRMDGKPLWADRSLESRLDKGVQSRIASILRGWGIGGSEVYAMVEGDMKARHYSDDPAKE